jgi:hypothetical protein
MLIVLVEWVKNGQTPPPSRYPRVRSREKSLFDFDNGDAITIEA